MRTFHIVLPVDVIQNILTKRMIGPAKLYVYIQIKHQNRVIARPEFFSEVQRDLGIKDKSTINKYLCLLVKEGWMGNNGRVYYTRSIDYVHKEIGFYKRLAVKVSVSDLNKFKAFLAGVLISSLIRSGIRKAWATKRRALLQAYRSSSGYWIVSSSALSQILNVSISTALRLKAMAKEHGYVDIDSHFEKEDIPGEQIQQYRWINPDEAHKAVIKDGTVVIRMPDLCRSNMVLKRRTKKHTNYFTALL